MAEATATLPPLPDQKAKGWEFTDLSGLDIDSFAEGSPSASIDGGEGATVLPLSEARESHAELLAERLGALAPGDDPFVARNDAGWSDGVLVHVPAGVKLTEPVRVELPLDEDGAAVAWRTLVVLEEGAEAEVWEHCSSENDETEALLNSVVELHVGQAATLRYVSTQDISEASWIFATQRAQVERDGRLDWAALGFGSANGKVRMETKLAGPGSEARVTGGYAGGPGSTSTSTRTQEHAAPNTTSDLAFRGVLAAGSTRRLARDDQGRPRRPADRRLPGEPQPAALHRRPRRRDPGPRDPRRRRALHPRCGDRPDRPRAALLPDARAVSIRPRPSS